MKSKQLSKFGKVYFTYLAILLVILIAIFFGVRSSMVKYEASTPEGFVLSHVKEASKGKGELGKYLKNYCFDKELGDKKGREALFKQLASGNLEVQLNKKSFDTAHPVYDVKSGETPLLSMQINQGKPKSVLGILTMFDWDINYCILRTPSGFEKLELNENNLLNCDIYLPEGYHLFIDEIEYTASADEKQPIDEFGDMAKYADVPVMQVYHLTDLAFEPAVKITNNVNETAELKRSANSYTAEIAYGESPEAKEIINKIGDPIEIAKTWSKFMTDDIGGAKHGLDKVISDCRLYKGSDLYTQAEGWAKNVDITFVSGHTIKSWSDESVVNYVKYNDNLVSCDVSVTKNMVLKTGAKVPDVFHDRMYFANVNGSWYLFKLQSIR